ncbi:MAG: aldo/keto reductase [Candidatus Xenobiia bacterium LiM19]
MAASAGERVRIGKTGLSVSRLGFGTSCLGNMPETYGYEVDEARARATLDAIFDGPMNFIDTSRIYGLGRSEELIGAAIKARGGIPKNFVVSTKLDRDMKTSHFDGARARRSLEESMKALGLGHFHMLHLHDPEHAVSLEEITRKGGAVDELFKIKEEGFATAVGLAAGRVDIMMPILKEHDFDVIITHNRFTLINRNAEAMIDYCTSRNIAVLNAAPYAGGVLAKGSGSFKRYVYQKASDAMLDPVRKVEDVCEGHGVPTGPVALQFSMRDPRIASTLCGISKPDRVRETIEWATYPVPDAVWNDLESIGYTTDDPEATRHYER